MIRQHSDPLRRPDLRCKYRGMQEITEYVGYIPYEPTVRKGLDSGSGLGPEGEAAVLDGIWAPVWIYELCNVLAKEICSVTPIDASMNILQKVIDTIRPDPDGRLQVALTVWSLSLDEPQVVFSGGRISKNRDSIRFRAPRDALLDWVEVYGSPLSRFPPDYDLETRVKGLADVPRATFGPKIPPPRRF